MELVFVYHVSPKSFFKQKSQIFDVLPYNLHLVIFLFLQYSKLNTPFNKKKAYLRNSSWTPRTSNVVKIAFFGQLVDYL